MKADYSNKEQIFHRDVLRRFFRGESKQKILKALARRDVTDSKAQVIYHEVVSNLRSKVRLRYWKIIGLGALLIAGCLIVAVALGSFRESVTSRTVRASIALIVVATFGAGIFLRGVFGLFTADPRFDHLE